MPLSDTPVVKANADIREPEMRMQEVSSVLRNVFTYAGYPSVIVGIFVFIIGMIGFVINRRPSMRTATAAVLPVAALVFVVITDSEPGDSLTALVQWLPSWLKFIVGAGAGVFLLECGKRLLKSDIEVGPPLYVLFLSTTGVFILYIIMAKLLASIHVFLFGFVMGGGLQIILRGAPENLIAPKPEITGPAATKVEPEVQL